MKTFTSCLALLFALQSEAAAQQNNDSEQPSADNAESESEPEAEPKEETQTEEEVQPDGEPSAAEDSNQDDSAGNAEETNSEEANAPSEDAEPDSDESVPDADAEEEASAEAESEVAKSDDKEEDVGSTEEADESQEEPDAQEPAGGTVTDPVLPPALASPSSSKKKKEEKPKNKWREKPLRTTVGIPPTQRDLGNEADLFVDNDYKVEQKSKEWKLDVKAFLRGTARFSAGPKHSGQDGIELHAPARIPGLSSGDWDHIGVVPNPSAKAFFTAGTPNLSVNVILGGQPPIDEGYPNPKEAGWFLDSYLTMKFPRVFGHKGGIAWTAGAFAHRYGNAGKKSTGFYRTYLFGKTHVMGSAITADYDLTDHWELIVEHGIGAKGDVVPWINPAEPTRPDADYLQGQGDVPRGSNFVHHGHVQLRNDYWLRLGGHLMTSWTPNDRTFLEGERSEEARLNIMGVEANVDLPTGSGYLGYAHMDAKNVLPLSNGIQTLHASRGADIKKIYFGFKDRITGEVPSNDSGTIDTVLFQYVLQLANMFHLGRDLDVSLFGMYSHVNSPIENPNVTTQENLNYGRLKWGAEIQNEILPFMRASLRFDNVNSELSNPDRSFSAISPRLFFFTKKGSKEMIVVNYSYFLYGSEVYPGSPYRELAVSPDPHFFGISALMSL